MVDIDILEDDELMDCLNHMLSGCLPHENYDGSCYTQILTTIEKYIKTDEMSMEYYVLFDVLHKINKISSINNVSPRVTFSVFESVLQSNIGYDLITDNNVALDKWCLENGVEFRPQIEVDLENLCNIMYSRCIDLYKKCFELKVPSAESLSYTLALKESFMQNACRCKLRMQHRILTGKVKIGKKFYSGALGELEYSGMVQAEISSRVSDESSELVVLDSISKVKELHEKAIVSYTPLANYGIPPIDDATPMMVHRLVCLCGNPNIGKSSMAISFAVKLLLEGKRVIYMYGESSEEQFIEKVKSSYIKQKYGKFVTVQHLLGNLEVNDEIERIIKETDLAFSNGLFAIRGAYSYDNLYDELKSDYDRQHFDGVIIDHSLALLGNGSDYENVAKLSTGLRRFKKDYPVAVIVLSHLSVVVKDLIARGKDVEGSPTRGNSSLTSEADEIFVIYDNPTLRKQNLLYFVNTKRRDASVVLDKIILKKKFNVYDFEYDPSLQTAENETHYEGEEALRLLDSLSEDDMEDEDIDFDM